MANRALLIVRMGHEFDREWKAGRALSFDLAMTEALAQTALGDRNGDAADVLRSLDDLLGLAPMPGPGR